ncbi:unnamed protein product [Paramecium sonneborni]|uniref:Uncharacterized protein n=1 Tax=Paramecium sonneborni TaxID=65129 RepID=A0A8S1RLW2_9CILI|nr:unnamed protein product [Paramecium sonneborni]CAD8127775.1 unnamed protein product [Paramecium sonneborni]
MVDDQKKLQDDNKVIDEIQKQFEVLFSTPQYLQMNQIIKNTKCLINEANEDTIIIQSIKLTMIRKLQV